MEKTRFKKPENPVPTLDEQKNMRGIGARFCRNCRWAFKMPTGGVPQFMLICHGTPPGMQITATPQGPAVQMVPRGVPDEHFCKEWESLEVAN